MSAGVRSLSRGPENSSLSTTPTGCGTEMMRPSPSPPETMEIESFGESARACSVTSVGLKGSHSGSTTPKRVGGAQPAAASTCREK